jgi:hypothetical protein
MAKKDEQKAKSDGNGSGKSRMKVFVAGFDMEGSDETMAEGFKAIRELAASISRSTLLPPAMASKSLSAGGKTEGAKDAMSTETETEEAPVLAEVEDVESEDAAEETSSNGNGSGTKRPYSFKRPEFLNDLDVSKAKKDLKEFVAEKNPPDVMNKYLAIVYFLQKYMDIAEVTVDHIYTVFDILDWKTEMPLKAGKPLADLKSKRNMLTREPGAEGYKLNFKGEQEVNKMGATK